MHATQCTPDSTAAMYPTQSREVRIVYCCHTCLQYALYEAYPPQYAHIHIYRTSNSCMHCKMKVDIQYRQVYLLSRAIVIAPIRFFSLSRLSRSVSALSFAAASSSISSCSCQHTAAVAVAVVAAVWADVSNNSSTFSSCSCKDTAAAVVKSTS
jgi:hypothetical protein